MKISEFQKYFIKFLDNPFLILDKPWVCISKYIKSDAFFLRVYYRIRMKERLDLLNPTTFTQKIQWLKIYDRKPEYTTLVDKYAVRELVKTKIGDQYIVPLLGVWNNFEEINFDILPDKFVLKATHDSGSVVLVKNKLTFLATDKIKQANTKLSKSLKRNYFFLGREYPYKEVKPRIIAEHYLANQDGSEIVDYKFFCFDGVPKVLFVASDRFNGETAKFDYYDMNFKRLPFISKGHPFSLQPIEKPETFEEMITIASKLSQGFHHIRIDLFNVNNKIYFGEFTFYHDGGVVPFIPKEWNLILGSWIKIPS